jgi:Flp pilus assembly protein protease CpaA
MPYYKLLTKIVFLKTCIIWIRYYELLIFALCALMYPVFFTLACFVLRRSKLDTKRNKNVRQMFLMIVERKIKKC